MCYLDFIPPQAEQQLQAEPGGLCVSSSQQDLSLEQNAAQQLRRGWRGAVSPPTAEARGRSPWHSQNITTAQQKAVYFDKIKREAVCLEATKLFGCTTVEKYPSLVPALAMQGENKLNCCCKLKVQVI